jgi:hypothetical protein
MLKYNWKRCYGGCKLKEKIEEIFAKWDIISATSIQRMRFLVTNWEGWRKVVIETD